MNKFKIELIRYTPSLLLNWAWRLGIVPREVVFRWEMNVVLDEWT